jgi:hypothetical protein
MNYGRDELIWQRLSVSKRAVASRDGKGAPGNDKGIISKKNMASGHKYMKVNFN